MFLMFSLMPGAAEAVENIVHVAGEGHLAHGAVHEHEHENEHENEHEGDEHGCSSTFHLCSCHTSTVPFQVRDAKPHQCRPDVTGRTHTVVDYVSPVTKDVTSGLFRPPRS